MAGSKNDVIVGKNADFSQAGAPNATTGEANGLATDGQLWVGTTALNAGGTHINVGTITSPDASVIVGYSSPDITLTAVGVSPTTFDGDTGNATPTLNVIQLLGGTNGIDTTASGNTVTFNFDVTEQPTIPTSFPTPSGTAIPALNALTFANGTGVSITGAGSTVTINASAAVPTTFTTDSGVATPAANNLNVFGGPGITTSGSGSTITINGPAFTDTTATTLTSDNGYFATAAGTYTLPASPSQGDLIMIAADTTGAVAVTANTGQIIRLGAQVTSTAGSLTSTARGDSLILRYRTTGAVWMVFGPVGNWTYA